MATSQRLDTPAFLDDLLKAAATDSGTERSEADPPPARSMTMIQSPGDLPADWRVDWEERAAIMEYDGGLPRERAEALALDIIVRQMRRAGIGVRQI